MKGYKIAFYEEYIQGTDVLKGLHYGTTLTRVPVLVVLDIPDDAKTSTPENRYTEENMCEILDRWRSASLSLMPPYINAALKDCDAYCAHKDEKPLAIYNEFVNAYSGELAKFVHASKCRCNKARVIDIVGIFNGTHYTRAVSMFDADFRYEVGKTVSCEDFNTYSRMAVCAPGIHYFEYPVFAILYMLEQEEGFVDAVREGEIDDRVTKEYLTEGLNALKRRR